MRVIATAGHVDHGKSALVSALTGMQPDRWQAERDRGLTIDLGFAWTQLPDGQTIAFVDVPGHERFIGNMVAGIGPTPAVMFIVAADEGWSAQSEEHLAALHALDVRRGLLVITKTDLADPGPVAAHAARRLAASSLAGIPQVPVSARTGAGIDRLRTALADLAETVPVPTGDRFRLWVDRSFSIRGAGTVVTGTLPGGQLSVGDDVWLAGRRLRIRGLQSLDEPHQQVVGPARVAVNLADLPVAEIGRGDVLTTSADWSPTSVVDARYVPPPAEGVWRGEDVDSAAGAAGGAHGGQPAERLLALPRQLMLHVGTAAAQVTLRPLAGDVVRLTLPGELPLVVGDRAILRNPGTHRIVGGVLVVDADPPRLHRRGAGRRRGEQLAEATGSIDLPTEVTRRGVVSRERVRQWGIDPDTPTPTGVHRIGDYFVAAQQWQTWVAALTAAVDAQASRNPLEPTLSAEAARFAADLPDATLLGPVVSAAGLTSRSGRISRPGVVADLGAAEPGLRAMEARLAADPFAAPERDELKAAGLGVRELAAGAGAGRILRLPGDIILLPDGPAKAMRVLAGLPQPFTLSQARQALGSTRRVVVPLLEHLDGRGWTRRVDDTRRTVVRG